MRLHVLSDLHLEQEPFEPNGVEADAVVLAGDTGTGTDGVQWARELANGRPVLYVAGNHEFYGHALPGLVNELRHAAAGSSVHVLENDEVVIDGVRFLGCTLWSDFDFDGQERREQSMRICERVVNDYGQISFEPDPGTPTERTLAARDTRTVHVDSRCWLAARLAEPHDGPTVIITHHAPMIRSRPREAVWRAIAGAFASDLTDLMGGDRVGLWIFGHTHRAADVEVKGTRVISNPRGYPHQPVPEFDPNRVIQIDDRLRHAG